MSCDREGLLTGSRADRLTQQSGRETLARVTAGQPCSGECSTFLLPSDLLQSRNSKTTECLNNSNCDFQTKIC